jgi:hypothetical protein
MGLHKPQMKRRGGHVPGPCRTLVGYCVRCKMPMFAPLPHPAAGICPTCGFIFLAGAPPLAKPLDEKARELGERLKRACETPSPHATGEEFEP